MIHRLTGKIVVDGAPREGAYLRVNGPSGDFVWEARTDEDGIFGFNLPPGTWTLLAFAPGASDQAQQVELLEDRSDVLIDLQPAN
ncbi:MAG: DUF1416 domain-containing protein [Actinomycetota bacterium]